MALIDHFDLNISQALETIPLGEREEIAESKVQGVSVGNILEFTWWKWAKEKVWIKLVRTVNRKSLVSNLRNPVGKVANFGSLMGGMRARDPLTTIPTAVLFSFPLDLPGEYQDDTFTKALVAIIAIPAPEKQSPLYVTLKMWYSYAQENCLFIPQKRFIQSRSAGRPWP